jgi:hypothetical protein
MGMLQNRLSLRLLVSAAEGLGRIRASELNTTFAVDHDDHVAGVLDEGAKAFFTSLKCRLCRFAVGDVHERANRTGQFPIGIAEGGGVPEDMPDGTVLRDDVELEIPDL